MRVILIIVFMLSMIDVSFAGAGMSVAIPIGVDCGMRMRDADI